MKRFILIPVSVLLFISIFHTLAGGFIAFELSKKQVKKAIKLKLKAGVPKNELVTFNISSAQYKKLQWVKKDKEFKLGKEMFDVVTRTEDKEKITLVCINDKQETELFKQLDWLVDLNMGNAKNLPASKKGNGLLQFASSLFCESYSNYQINRFSSKYQYLLTNETSNYSSHLTILYPPPDFFIL